MPQLATCLQVHLLSTSSPHSPIALIQQRLPGLEYFVAHSKGQLFILTNAHGAANYQVMTALLQTPSLPFWRPLIPERPHVAVQDLEVFASHAVLYERHHGRPAVSVLNLKPHSHGAQGSQPQAATRPDQEAGSQLVNSASISPQAEMQQHQTNRSSPDLLNGSQQSACTHNHVPPSNDEQQLLQKPPQHQQAPGWQLTTVPIPPWALSVEPGANPDYTTHNVRLHMASPVHPQHVYDYHLGSGQLLLLGIETVPGHDSEQYVCQVQYATSADGTQV